MATHSSIPAWEILWTEEHGGLQSMVSQRDTTEQLTLSFTFNIVIHINYKTRKEPKHREVMAIVQTHVSLLQAWLKIHPYISLY